MYPPVPEGSPLCKDIGEGHCTQSSPSKCKETVCISNPVTKDHKGKLCYCTRAHPLAKFIKDHKITLISLHI